LTLYYRLIGLGFCSGHDGLMGLKGVLDQEEMGLKECNT